jgi:hypothetical protein
MADLRAIELRTERDSMVNEASVADHLRAIDFGFKVVPDPLIEGVRRYGRHVVDFIGHDKPWGHIGRVALENFRLDQTCIYFIGPAEGPIKIGLTNAPLNRVRDFQIGSPVILKIHALTYGALPEEQAYHARFAAHRLHGEWFAPHPDILAEITRLATAPVCEGK